jgi:hypothetical protein
MLEPSRHERDGHPSVVIRHFDQICIQRRGIKAKLQRPVRVGARIVTMAVKTGRLRN